jgi:hypothetical protein
MSLKTLSAKIDYLLTRANCRQAEKMRIRVLLKELANADLKNETRFEFSVKVKNAELDSSFRVVNYEGNTRDSQTYEHRIILIRKLLANICPDFNCERMLSMLKTGYRVPLYIGIEYGNGDIFLKLYINFYELNKKNVKITLNFLKLFLLYNKIDIPVRNQEIVLLSLSFDKNGLRDEFKLYYPYSRKSASRVNGFSKKDVAIFEWLNARNKLDYFDVMERYIKNKLVSKKIEVHPEVRPNFLEDFVRLNCNKTWDKTEISQLIEEVNGELEVIAIEQGVLTFYVTLLGQGSLIEKKLSKKYEKS